MFNKFNIWKKADTSSNLRERITEVKNTPFLLISRLSWMEMGGGQKKSFTKSGWTS